MNLKTLHILKQDCIHIAQENRLNKYIHENIFKQNLSELLRGRYDHRVQNFFTNALKKMDVSL